MSDHEYVEQVLAELAPDRPGAMGADDSYLPSVEQLKGTGLSPEDFKLTSTGRLSRHDDEIEPGDVVSVESFSMSPKLLLRLGITPNMTEREAADRLIYLARQDGPPLERREE